MRTEVEDSNLVKGAKIATGMATVGDYTKTDEEKATEMKRAQE